MDLAPRLVELQKRVEQHREVLLTEEAAKTALVLPFIQALGYDVFNPSEVIPEFTADVGTKKGEKVDYAIAQNGKIGMLIECKPASVKLDLTHAGQLFRYFSVTDARVAVLTNGVIYDFYSDVDRPNKMDDKPFFSFNLESIRQNDARILESFAKSAFDIEAILQEAATLKVQGLLRKEIEREFAQPSDEFVKLLTSRVHEGNVTQAIKERYSKLISVALSAYVRDLVNDRLSSALNAAGPAEETVAVQEAPAAEEQVLTTQEEVSGFHIVQAIASRVIDPRRIVMRDQQSYCSILLDNNNRKTLCRLHFNALTKKYLGTFTGKEEKRQLISDLTQIYQFETVILNRISELEKPGGAAAAG